MKKCAKCRKEKPESDFCAREQLSDGLSSYCRECWGKINYKRRDEMLAQQKEYRAKNKKKRKEAWENWIAENRDERNARRRAQYAAAKAAKSSGKKTGARG